jgi:hypothetical protein
MVGKRHNLPLEVSVIKSSYTPLRFECQRQLQALAYLTVNQPVRNYTLSCSPGTYYLQKLDFCICWVSCSIILIFFTETLINYML